MFFYPVVSSSLCVAFLFIANCKAQTLCFPGSYCGPFSNLVTQSGTYRTAEACGVKCNAVSSSYQYFSYVPSSQQCLCTTTCSTLINNPNVNSYCLTSSFIPTLQPVQRSTVSPTVPPSYLRTAEPTSPTPLPTYLQTAEPTIFSWSLLYSSAYCGPFSNLVTQVGTYATDQACGNQCASASSSYRYFSFVPSSQQCLCTTTCSSQVTNADAMSYERFNSGPYNLIPFAGMSGVSTTTYGEPALQTGLGTLRGLWGDTNRNLYVANAPYFSVITNKGVIQVIGGNGHVSSAGGSGPFTSLPLVNPFGVWGDANGEFLYFTDQVHVFQYNIASGNASVYAGGNELGYLDGPVSVAQFSDVEGITIDTNGVVYIADTAPNNLIRTIQDGIVSTFAGSFKAPIGGGGYSGDNGPATSAELNGPLYVWADTRGNVYIPDRNNCAVRKVFNGIITTFAGSGPNNCGYSGDGNQATAAQMNIVIAVAGDSIGNIYITDSSNYRIRKVNVNGIISTIAGNGMEAFSWTAGPATLQSINYPNGIYVNASGAVFISQFECCMSLYGEVSVAIQT